MNIETILFIYKLITIICLPMSIILFIFFFLSWDLVGKYLGARIFKSRALEILLRNNGTIDFYNIKRSKGLAVDGEGNFFQDFVRVKKKEADITKNKTAWGKDYRAIRPLDYYYRGIRFWLRKEGDIPALDRDGKPASLDHAELSLLRNLDRDRVLKRNKIVKERARPFPILFILVVVIVILVVYFLLKQFTGLSFL